jgi:hypothetical protein
VSSEGVKRVILGYCFCGVKSGSSRRLFMRLLIVLFCVLLVGIFVRRLRVIDFWVGARGARASV